MRWKDTAKTLYRDTIGLQQFKQAAKAILLGEYDQLRERERKRLPDDIALRGYKVYSQNDEDGLIAAIFEQLGGGETFMEIGVEDGRECNTHLLMLKGWRGAWVDGNPQSCQSIRQNLGGSEFGNTFRIVEQFVYPDNIVELYKSNCAFLGTDNLDFFSLDVDGNDAYIIDELLTANCRPKVCCFEYNGKFPADVDISVAFSKTRGWEHNDYFGASLLHFVNILEKHDYKLITCNLTGANVFFVDRKLGDGFPDRTAADVWRTLRFDLAPLPGGHRASLSFLADKVRQG